MAGRDVLSVRIVMWKAYMLSFYFYLLHIDVYMLLGKFLLWCLIRRENTLILSDCLKVEIIYYFC